MASCTVVYGVEVFRTFRNLSIDFRLRVDMIIVSQEAFDFKLERGAYSLRIALSISKVTWDFLR